MIRIFWGVVLIVVGALFALQTFGVLSANLTFWPVIFTIVGMSLVVRGLFPSPFRLRSGPAWLKLSFGVWLAGIGLFDILHANEIIALSGRDVWSVGWFVLLIGAGLTLIFGHGKTYLPNGDNGQGGSYREKCYWGKQWLDWRDPEFYRQKGRIGDLHYGRESWVLQRKFNIKHQFGDVRLDLTTAQIGEGTYNINVVASAGEIVILVPSDCNAIVRARTGAGTINVFGDRRDGVASYLENSFHVPESTATLNIDVRLRLGEVSVRHVPVHKQED